MLIFRSIWIAVMIAGIMLRKKKYQKLGWLVAFGYMFFISAFRGDFTADYNSYFNIFKWIQNARLTDFFTPSFEIYYTEKGFALINYIVGFFTDNFQVIVIVSSIMVLYPYYKYAKESNHGFLFMLLFICIGPLFQSFNMIRQAVAASICCIAYSYLIKGNFKKYILIILLAGTIHVSSFLMLPLYWLLRMRLTKGNIFMQIVIISTIYSLFEKIKFLLDRLMFSGKYATLEVSMTQPIESVIVPALLTIYIFIMLRHQNRYNMKKTGWKDDLLTSKKNERERAIAYNGTIIWFLTFLFALKTYYCYRLAVYLCFFPIIAIIYSIDDINNIQNKKIIVSTFVVGLSAYYLLFGQYYGEYKFCF